jgi:hypothetical protein
MRLEPATPKQRMANGSKQATRYHADQPIGEIGACDADDGVASAKAGSRRYSQNCVKSGRHCAFNPSQRKDRLFFNPECTGALLARVGFGRRSMPFGLPLSGVRPTVTRVGNAATVEGRFLISSVTSFSNNRIL